MTDYGELATRLGQARANLQSDHDSIDTILKNIVGIYHANSALKLCGDISTTLSALEKQIQNIASFESYLKLLKSHADTLKQLNHYKGLESSWQPTSTNPLVEETNPYSSDVSRWETNLKNIETSIFGSYLDVPSYTASIKFISVDGSTYKDYAVLATNDLGEISTLNLSFANVDALSDDAAEWITDFQTKDYWTNGFNKRLADFVSADEIDRRIEEAAGNADPRTRAVTAAMTIIALEEENHFTTRYVLSWEGNRYGSSQPIHHGINKPYDTEALVSEGADCASFTCWSLNKAVPFNNATVKTVSSLGEKTDFASLKPGDLVYSNSHVALVMDNQYEENGSIIVADTSRNGNPDSVSNWTPGGIRLKRYSERDLKVSFHARDLSSFYGES